MKKMNRTLEVGDRALINRTLDEASALLERLNRLSGTTDQLRHALQKIHADIVVLTTRIQGAIGRTGFHTIKPPIFSFELSNQRMGARLEQFLCSFSETLDILLEV